ncbi:MAG: hypothetical protein AAF654_06695 [Myxococcota bacterium]
MSRMIDEYIGQLPDGIGSYPDCKSAMFIPNLMRDRLHELNYRKPHPALEPMLSGAYDREKYMPEVESNALHFALRELVGDEGFEHELEVMSGAAFKSPLYRALMLVMSPSLIIMGASSRWRAFHLNSHLNSMPVERVNGGKRCEGTLEGPPYLFNAVMHNAIAVSLRTAIRMTGANDATVVVKEVTATTGFYVCEWSE